MERSIALCNGISQWVQLMVLSRPTPQLRAEVFTKFIYVAQVTCSTFQQHHQDVLPPPRFNDSDPLTTIDHAEVVRKYSWSKYPTDMS